MTSEQLNNIWNYYLSLEQNLAETARYVEPNGQEDVFSFEFAKILILSCTEIESVFKLLCREFKEEKGDISGYKEIILENYPTIVKARVTVRRLGRDIVPFSEWGFSRLQWWDAYTAIKHDRDRSFGNATYINAVMALGALYVLIFFLAHKTGLTFEDTESQYISSEYRRRFLTTRPGRKLPDFEKTDPIDEKGTFYLDTK